MGFALKNPLWILNMSSWQIGPPSPPIRIGWKQLSPEGTFQAKPLPATVVSAFYPMKSKHALDNYKKWIRMLLENLDAPLVFFTEETFAKFIVETRSRFSEKTKVIILPRDEWVANKKFSQSIWDAQYEIDPEKNIHSAELYKVWYEKKEFVMRAIEMNPFGSTDFLWCDAGIVRYDWIIPLMKNFPVADRIPTDRIMISNVWPFTRSDEAAVKINGETFVGGASGKPRVGTNVIAASANLWIKFSTLYDDIVQKYLRAGLFFGKDQNVATKLVLEYKNLISLVDSKQFFYDTWVFVLVWLGAPPRLFEFCRKEPWYGRKRSAEELARMI